jgi:hypothetical protein
LVALRLEKVIHLMAIEKPMCFLDKLARVGKRDAESITWAGLESWDQLFLIITIISLPFTILLLLIELS